MGGGYVDSATAIAAPPSLPVDPHTRTSASHFHSPSFPFGPRSSSPLRVLPCLSFVAFAGFTVVFVVPHTGIPLVYTSYPTLKQSWSPTTARARCASGTHVRSRPVVYYPPHVYFRPTPTEPRSSTAHSSRLVITLSHLALSYSYILRFTILTTPI